MKTLQSMVVSTLFSAVLVAQAHPPQTPLQTSGTCKARERLTVDEFESVMQQIADAWNKNDARRAADCFTSDAVYSAPPSAEHIGSAALFEFFGGARGRDLPMRMTWHHLVFDPTQQLGTGEYTFRYKIQTHGMVILKFSRGRISNWREYEVESKLPWEEFVRENRF